MSREYAPRVNAAPLAREFKMNGFQPSVESTLPFGQIEPLSNEAFAAFSKYKPEMYAIGSLFAEKVVSRAVSETPITDWTLPVDNSFLLAGARIHGALYRVIDEDMTELRSNNAPDEELRNFNRLEELTEFIHEILPHFRNEPGTDVFLQEGCGTAVDIMSGILEVLPKIDPSVNNPEELQLLARNSFPLIAKLAADHAAITITRQDCLRPDMFMAYNPNMFRFKEIHGLRYLDFSGEALEEFEFIESFTDILPDSSKPVTVGCPGLINAGNGTAVRTLWNWYLKQAEVIYPKMLANRQSYTL